MIAHPILIKPCDRQSPTRALRLCRPSEAVLDILPNPDFGAFHQGRWRTGRLGHFATGKAPTLDLSRISKGLRKNEAFRASQGFEGQKSRIFTSLNLRASRASITASVHTRTTSPIQSDRLWKGEFG